MYRDRWFTSVTDGLISVTEVWEVMIIPDQRSKVIVICGSASGVGKSTLVNRLSELIPDSCAMYFDAYHRTTEYPPDMYRDVMEGKEIDLKQIRNTEFFDDLIALCHGKSITDPWGRVLNGSKYIILEEPFGKSRSGMDELVDFIATIHLPLDIALARRLLRNIRIDHSHMLIEENLRSVETFLDAYLHGGGRLSYEKLYEVVSADSNLILDGTTSVDQMAELVIQRLNELEVIR